MIPPTGRRRWGRAGQRLGPTEAAHRDRRAQDDQRQREEQQAEDRRVAYEKWRAGMVVPHAITTALNICQLDGPEVDQACGVREPGVDLWEDGKLYPTWPQLQALAALTGYELLYFVTARPSIGILDTSMANHIRSDELRLHRRSELHAIMRYPDTIWQRCPGTGWPPPT